DEQHVLTIGEELDDEIDESPGDDDRVLQLLAVDVRGNARKLSFARDKLVLIEAGGHLHLAADAAVHLDDELEGLALEVSRVGLGPRSLPEPLVAQALPELFRDVRPEPRGKGDRGLRREAHSSRLPGIVLRGIDVVDELGDGGNGGVELEAALDVVG